MSIAALSNAFNPFQLGATTSPYPQLKQLGQNLQSGNLSAAQSEFASLQQAFSQSSTTSSAATSPASPDLPVTQTFAQLGSDLLSGNVSGAQKDLSTLQQDFGNQTKIAGGHFHHHGASENGGSTSSTTPNSLLQDFSLIGQSLASNNLSAAQQSYATLQQQLEQFALGGSLSSSQASALLSQSPISFLA